MCTSMPRSMRSTTTPSPSKTEGVHPNRGDGRYTRPARANRCGNPIFLKRCPKRPEQVRRHWRDFGPTAPLDRCYWPVTPMSAAQSNVRFRGRSGLVIDGRIRSLVIHGVISPPSIAASRKIYSITSSASTSKLCGIVRPSALAVLRLMTNSNLVGCMTGRSAGLMPLRTFPT